MEISIEHASLIFTCAEQTQSKPHYAALVYIGKGGDPTLETDGLKVVAIGVSDQATEFDSGSAIVNLLQNIDEPKKPSGSYFIASTKSPTERDLGMARMRNITRFIYRFNGKVWEKRRDNNGDNWTDKDFEKHLDGTLQKVGSSKKTLKTTITYRFKAGSHIPKLHPPSPRVFAEWRDSLIPDEDLDAPVIATLAAQFCKIDLRRCTRRKLKLPELEIPTFERSRTRVDSPVRHLLFMQLAWAITALSYSQSKEPRLFGRPGGNNIGCVLRGPNDEILGWGINLNQEHQTLHGEVMMIQSYQARNKGKRIPDESWLYTTLEPCNMCAGMFVESGQNLKCIYGQRDDTIGGTALRRCVNGITQEQRRTRVSILFSHQGLKDEKGTRESRQIPLRLGDEEHLPRFMHAVQQYAELPLGIPDSDRETRQLWLDGCDLIDVVFPDNPVELRGSVT